MKIGIDIRNIGKKRTGDEVVFFNLTKNLALIDNENKYLLFTDIQDTEILNDIKKRLGIEDKNNFEIISLSTKNKFTWNFWTLPKYLRQNSVDIYLTQYITPFFVPKKIKIFTIIHDVSFNVYGKYIKFSDLFFLKILIPLSLRRADKIIGVSQFTQEEIKKYYSVDSSKLDWIHNAVSDNFQKGISPEKCNEIRKKYNLPEKSILYIGTLQPRKNLSTLIEAYAKLPEHIKNEFKLVLAGGKGHNYDTAIDKTTKKYSLEDNIIMPGFIDEDDKPAIFKLSTVFCNPSFYEGFGIPILEAMTLGIPVLASDIMPHREVADDSVLYFNPNDYNELREKLLSVISHEQIRQELTQKELIRAKNFSWQNTAKKALSLFYNTC